MWDKIHYEIHVLVTQVTFLHKNKMQLFSMTLFKICTTKISGPDGPLILAVDLRNTPKGCPMGPLF